MLGSFRTAEGDVMLGDVIIGIDSKPIANENDLFKVRPLRRYVGMPFAPSRRRTVTHRHTSSHVVTSFRRYTGYV